MYEYVYKPLPKGAKVILRELGNCSSIKELAEKTGYKISTVYFYICNYSPCKKEKRQRALNIINQLKQGKKQCVIAKENNVSRQYVNNIKKKMEIKND